MTNVSRSFVARVLIAVALATTVGCSGSALRPRFQMSARPVEVPAGLYDEVSFADPMTADGRPSVKLSLTTLLKHKPAGQGRLAYLKRSAPQAATGFHVTYHPAVKIKPMQTFLQQTGVIDNVADLANDWLRAPNVGIHVRECSLVPALRKNAVNAFYNRKAHTITFCYELAADALALFKLEGKTASTARLRDQVAGAVSFILMHEIAHALIHELGLPAIGREEDAADQFAALALMRLAANGRDIALTAATRYDLKARRTLRLSKGNVKYPFYDEHSMHEQRKYNLMCLVFGSNVKENISMVSKGELPMRRARRCVAEYRQLDTNWQILLRDHLRQ